MKLAEKILGRELKSDRTAIVDIVNSALQYARQQENLVVRVNPAEIAVVQEHLEQLKSYTRSKFIDVTADPRVGIGGCLIESEVGTVDARLETQFRVLKKVLACEGGSEIAFRRYELMINLEPYIDSFDWITSVEVRGRVTELVGLLIRAAVPGARVGEVCLIHSPHRSQTLRAEVVGFRGSEVILMPLGEVSDVAMGAEVVPTGASLSIKVGDDLLGRVVGRSRRTCRRKGNANWFDGSFCDGKSAGRDEAAASTKTPED